MILVSPPTPWRFGLRSLCLALLLPCWLLAGNAPKIHTPAAHTSSLLPAGPKLSPAEQPINIDGRARGTTRDMVPGDVQLSITGGFPPYSIKWNNLSVPEYNDVISSIYANFEGDTTVTIDTADIHGQLNYMKQLTRNDNLAPNVYYAQVTDAHGNTGYAGGVVTRAVDWLYDPHDATISNSQSELRAINGITWLPADGQTITKLNGGDLGSGYTISRELFYPSDYSYFDFEGPGYGPESRSGLAVIDNDNPQNPNDMLYFLRFEGNLVTAIANGEPLSGPLSYQPGDVFGIELRDGYVLFYKNHQLFDSPGDIVLDMNNIYQYKNMFTAPGSTIGNLKVVKVPLDPAPADPTGPMTKFIDHIEATITDVTCSNSCTGVIKATASMLLATDLFGPRTRPSSFSIYPVSAGVVSPTPLLTYNINSFSVTFSNLCAGDYQIKFTYINPNGGIGVLTGNFTVAFMPDWTGVTNSTVSSVDRSLSKSSVYTACDAGAYSVNELAYSTSTEWLEFGVQMQAVFPFYGNADDAFIGLTETSGNLPSTLPQNIQYGMGFNSVLVPVFPPGGIYGTFISQGWYYVVVNAGGVGTAYMGYSFNPNDRFKIEKTGNTIRFYRSGALINTPASLSLLSTSPMRVDASLCERGSAFLKPRVTFGCFMPLYAILKKEMDGHCYRCDRNQLYFKYDEEYQDTDKKLQFNIYDDKHDKVVSSAALASSLVPVVYYGDNRYGINLNNTSYTGGTLLSPGYYVLEVINEKNEYWYLRFKK